MPLVSLILAERCVVATERDDWAAAVLRSERATTVDDGGFDGYWTSALVFATAARSAAHSGRHARGAAGWSVAHDAAPVAHLRLPVVSVQALVELAHAYIGFAEQGGAARC